MKKHAFRIGLVVTMLLGLMMISANAASCTYENPHPTVATPGVHDAAEWTTLSSDITAATTWSGNYVLAEEATINFSAKITVSGKVVLCLNGSTLNYNGTSDTNGDVFTLAEGAELHICDCHAKADSGSITSSRTSGKMAMFYASKTVKLHLWNGAVENIKYGNMGSAVKFSGTGENLLHIHGADVKNNADKQGTGGGAVHQSGGTITICDGEISGNVTNGNGAVFYLRYGTVDINIYGGTFKNNKANSTSKTGGVFYMHSTCKNAVINIEGGVFTGNQAKAGGAIFQMHSSITGVELNISGDAEFINSTSVSAFAFPAAGVTTNLTGGTFSDDITNLTLAEGYIAYDNGDGTYTVYEDGKQPGAGAVAVHPGDDREWLPLTADTELITGLNYYLETDLTLDETLVINQNITLCLHGNTLTSSAAENAISVGEGITLNIEDCDDGCIKPAEGVTTSRAILLDAGTVNMSGGTISGFGSADVNGGAVKMAGASAKFNMSGGTITNNKGGLGGAFWIGGTNTTNKSTLTISGTAVISNNEALTAGDDGDGGGAIYCSSATGYRGNAVTISGGTISGNKAQDGGAIRIGTGATVTMTGGTISGNIASRRGGVIILYYAGTFTMSGGTISGNNATVTGGAIGTQGGGTVNLNGGVISGNTSKSGGAFYLHGSSSTKAKLNIKGAEISDNTGAGGAGYIYNTYATVTMTSGYVFDNHADPDGSGMGAGFYVYNGNLVISGGNVGVKKDGTIASNYYYDNAAGKIQPATGTVAYVYESSGTVEISGGNFATRNNSDPFLKAQKGTITVTGGYFNYPASGNTCDYDTFIGDLVSYKVSDSTYETVPYTVAPAATATGAIALGNSVAMNFAVSGLPGVAADYTATVNGSKVAMNDFTFSYGVPAKDMGKDLVLSIKNDGNVVATLTTSVKAQADAILADTENATYTEAMQNAVKYMLHYGAAAQTYFKDTNALVNAGLEAPVDVDLSNVVVTDAAKELYMGSSVSLKGNIIVNLYFSNDVTSVTLGGQELDLVEKGNYQVAVIDDIVLPQADLSFTFTINGTTEVTDSIGAYAYRANNMAEAVDGLAALCQAMMNFVNAVKGL